MIPHPLHSVITRRLGLKPPAASEGSPDAVVLDCLLNSTVYPSIDVINRLSRPPAAAPFSSMIRRRASLSLAANLSWCRAWAPQHGGVTGHVNVVLWCHSSNNMRSRRIVALTDRPHALAIELVNVRRLFAEHVEHVAVGRSLVSVRPRRASLLEPAATGASFLRSQVRERGRCPSISFWLWLPASPNLQPRQDPASPPNAKRSAEIVLRPRVGGVCVLPKSHSPRPAGVPPHASPPSSSLFPYPLAGVLLSSHLGPDRGAATSGLRGSFSPIQRSGRLPAVPLST